LCPGFWFEIRTLRVLGLVIRTKEEIRTHKGPFGNGSDISRQGGLTNSAFPTQPAPIATRHRHGPIAIASQVNQCVAIFIIETFPTLKIRELSNLLQCG
jgi:hypothetical protein